MLLSPTESRDLLARAARERFALLAVNADSPAAITDVLEAARICDAPVIIETSLWQLTGRSFGAGDAATGLARYLVQIAQLAASPLELARELLGSVEGQAPGFIHLWAPGVGTRHGLGDQRSFSADAVRAHHEVASEIAGRPVGIALHGSSGLDADPLRAAVRAGVTKVNWSSESLLLRSQAAAEFYRTHAAQLQPGHPEWKNTAMDNGLQQFVSERYIPRVVDRIRSLGSGNSH